MSGEQSERYDAEQDKDLLLSEEGASPTLSTARFSSHRQRLAVGLLLSGSAAAVALVAMSSHTVAVGKLSSKVGLQAYYGSDPVGQPAYDPYAAFPAYPAAASAQLPAPVYSQADIDASAAFDQGAYGAAAPAQVPAAPAQVPAPGGACGKQGDDCSALMCCEDPGYQCFQKQDGYATCRAVCEPGMIEEGEPWACLPLGEPAAILDGPEQCAWSGDNCIAKKCCNDANMKCFQKDGYFAGCLFKPQEEDGWDNTVLGEFRGWHQVYEPSDGERLGSNLYCIAVKSPNARVKEEELLAAAQQRSIGIYSCNDNDVFDGAAAPKTAWKSISNTDIFINVWEQVKQNGKFYNNDWTVKADPDCVFFGDRIGQHLMQKNVGKYDAVYIKNCNFKFRFQGSLEVFSEKAMEKYVHFSQMCSDKIGHEGGEDFFIMTCMDAMGVSALEDDDILYDKYATGEHLILDDVSHCKSGWTAAFHPFRTQDVWIKCAEAAIKAKQDAPPAK